MLLLKDIKKDYLTGSETVNALKGVSISFRKSEFVSILGQSGCGKTTLLNIVGGLDQYTSGDLVINGTSTKDFKDRDWDSYRNHSIGFVFQSYNLITHQTVLANVELALTLSGVSKEERRRRAKEALERVGLGNQLRKRPTQMSGGQMQRVAIARALVNNPDILLADEPTGALDSTTSVQIMEILKEIAQEKLVIMVTHNGELAEQYSTRIIKLHDGMVTDDSNPYTEEQLLLDEQNEKVIIKDDVNVKSNKKNKKGKKAKTSMSFWTALALSFNNLMTKKGRTILTAFAGSIGIIGIALILSLSTGIKGYIDQVQEETLASYPVVIEAETTDLTTMLESFMGIGASDSDHPKDKIYASDASYDLINSLDKIGMVHNNLKNFKKFLIDNETTHADYIAAIQYSYDIDFPIYKIAEDGSINKIDPNKISMMIMESQFPGFSSSDSSMSSYTSMMGSGISSTFCEIIPARDGGCINDIIYNQYELVEGDWPSKEDEIVLILNENNEISDLTLYGLGIMDIKELEELLNAPKGSETQRENEVSFEYSDIIGLEYKLVLPTDLYTPDPNKEGCFVDRSNDSAFVQLACSSAKSLTVKGIIRVKKGTTSQALSGSVGYTYKLTEWYINSINNSDIVKVQKANPEIDVLSGLYFPTEENQPHTPEEKLEKINEYLLTLDDSGKVALYKEVFATPTNKELELAYINQYGNLTAADVRVMIVEMLTQADPNTPKEQIKAMVNNLSDEQLMTMFKQRVIEQMSEMIKAQKMMQINMKSDAEILDMLNTELTDMERIVYIYNFIPSGLSNSTYEENLKLFSAVDLDNPKTISIYAKDFASKEKISDLIDEYNARVLEEDKITYTDYVALIMSGVSTIIDAISYVLIGFVSISLVVSSIMIGIITYISVLERTKEIGILRAIGASKRDISRVFRAETIIEGFAAGMIGILVTLLLCIPINIILYALSGIPGLKARLPFGAAVILVAISVLLTLIAGMFPSRMAAKKDPVEALRTE